MDVLLKNPQEQVPRIEFISNPAYGGEITGKTLDHIYTAPEAEYWAEALTFVVEQKKPNVGLHSMAWRGAQDNDPAERWLRSRIQMFCGDPDSLA